MIISPEALFNAIRTGDTNTSLHLINKLEHLSFYVRNKRGVLYSPLHFAALYGNHLVVQNLLLKGAKLNELNGEGLTACHIAAKHGHVDVLKVLLKQPDLAIEQQDYNGLTAIDVAADKKTLDIITDALSARRSYTPHAVMNSETVLSNDNKISASYPSSPSYRP